MQTQIALAALALALAGCAGVNTVERQTPVADRQVVPDRRIITEPSFTQPVRIVSVSEATVADGFLKIQVELRNHSAHTHHFNYRVQWFDANGMAIHSPTPVWITRQILPQQTMFVTAVAPTAAAKDFRIELYHK
jgi:uncharacterized protein YcfL